MTETEKLLNTAADIAKRRFIDPSESTVMDLFRRLCEEADAARYQDEEISHGQTLH